jgi:hypothetical protein
MDEIHGHWFVSSFLVEIQAQTIFAGGSLQRHRLSVRHCVAVSFGVHFFAACRLTRDDSLSARDRNAGDDGNEVADKRDAFDVVTPTGRE